MIKLKGFRTLLVNLALAVLPVLESTNVTDLGLEGAYASIYGALVAGINLMLRLVTTTPVGKSE